MPDAAAVEERVMPLSEYLALPDELRAEYVDGRALVNPPPSFTHQKICQRLVALLDAAVVAPFEVVAAAGWQIGPEHVRIPDVMLLERAPSGALVTEPPLVCVEVLSSNRSDDLVRKATEYLAAGVGQCWVVDPRDRVIDVFARTPTGWHTEARLTDEHPTARVALPGVGTVGLDVIDVLGHPVVG